MRWLRRLFHKSGNEAELDRELQFHLERQISDNLAAGLSPEQARRDALVKLGGIEQIKESVRDSRLETHFESLLRDFRYAFRNLRKDRRFTLIAILTLALGIGSTTVIFSVIDGVLFHPFPYKNADRLVSFSVLAADKVRAWRFPAAAFFDFKEQNHTFEDMFGLVFRGVHYASEQGTDEFFGGWVTPGTFESLGIKPLLGRSLMPEDAKAESPPVFVMSYRLWTKHFHRDPKIIGTTVILNRIPMTLVGVMPARFQFGIGECEVWMPLYLTRTSFVPGAGIEPNEVWTVGHLGSGVSAETAAADLQVIANRLGKTDSLYFPAQSRLVINAFNDNYVSYFFRITLYALMTAVAILLLIACSNVANLLLVRATVREKEMVIRASLGATRSRLIRQLLIESFLLTAASCVAGCMLAYLGLKGVVVAIPEKTIPSEASIVLSPAALLFALGITALTTFICGLAPALHSAHRDLQSALTDSGKGANGNFRHGKLRSYLVIAEIALSIVLLISSGLMMRTLLALERVDIGFNPANVFYARLALLEGQYDTAQEKKLLFQKILDRVTRVPGVLAAAEASSSPPYTWTWITIVARGEAQPRDRNAALVLCSEGYFQTLERHLLRGRLISTSDVDAARHIAVVNQTFAREHFKEEDPTGQEIRFSEFETLPDWPRNPYFEIIGVVGDAKNRGLQEPPSPEVYLPHTLTGAGQRGILVKSAVNPDLILESIRREVAAIDSNIALVDAETIERYLERSYYSGPQFMFLALCAVAVTGLILVVGGVFSVISYTLKMILAKGVRLVAAGIIVGLFASYGLTRFLASQIWGVSVTDPWTFVAVVLVISLVGVASCLLPARRAAQGDPLIAIRYE
jgi:predicted permease